MLSWITTVYGQDISDWTAVVDVSGAKRNFQSVSVKTRHRFMYAYLYDRSKDIRSTYF